MNRSLARRILLTVAYTEQFSFPLTPVEAYVRLIGRTTAPVTEFTQTCSDLIALGKLEFFEGYFFIPGHPVTQKEEFTKTRVKRQKISHKKWQEVSKLLAFVKKIPFISGVLVTGSLAMNNTVDDDDIDFMIVTRKNRLWLARILIIIFASNLKKRRSFAKEEKNSWCFNLWVEESDLQLPPSSRSLYEAYEVAQACWVFSRGNTQASFFKLNTWAKTKVPLYRSFFTLHSTKRSQRSQYFQYSQQPYQHRIPVFSELLDLLNFFLYQFQYWYMKPHMTREKVSRSHAFFHPRDTRAVVHQNWKKTLQRMVQ